MREQMDGLQEAGLAAAVVAGDQVEAGLRVQFRFGETTKRLQLEAADQHWFDANAKRQRPAGAGRWIGCST